MREIPGGWNVFTKEGAVNHTAPHHHPLPHLYHTSQKCMIWYVGQYPFCSEPAGEICLVARCHSDYWGDTERLSWSGMREPAIWDSCVIAATRNHTHTHTHWCKLPEKWVTSHSLFCSADPCNRVQYTSMLGAIYGVQQSDCECVIKQNASATEG